MVQQTPSVLAAMWTHLEMTVQRKFFWEEPSFNLDDFRCFCSTTGIAAGAARFTRSYEKDEDG
jgi:hypothetical protein